MCTKNALKVIFSEVLHNLDCVKINDMYTDANVTKRFNARIKI